MDQRHQPPQPDDCERRLAIELVQAWQNGPEMVPFTVDDMVPIITRHAAPWREELQKQQEQITRLTAEREELLVACRRIIIYETDLWSVKKVAQAAIARCEAEPGGNANAYG